MNDHYQQLVNYLHEQLGAGHQPDTLRQSLIDTGWDTATIDRAMAEVTMAEGAAAPSLPPPQDPQLAQADTALAAAGMPQTPVSEQQAPKKYKLFRSVADTVAAIKNNALAYFLSGITSIIVAVILISILGFAASALVLSKIGLLSAGGVSFLVSLIIIGLIAYFTAVVSVTFIQIVNALSLGDGADGKKSHTITLLKEGLRLVPRVILTNLFVGLLAVGPLLAATILQLVLIFGARPTGDGSGTGLLIAGLLFSLMGFIWIFIALLNYSLSSTIAIFERDISIRHIPKRSRHLLQQGGKWFIFKGILLVLLLVLILAAGTGQNLQELQDSSNIAVNCAFLVVEILINGSLVMLYRNRRVVQA